MSTKKPTILLWTILITSCTVTNNLYVTDPVPQGKGNSYLYAGFGTGLSPDIDSTSVNGDIHFSDKLILVPSFCFGGQVGLGNQLDLRFDLHLPYIITGIGLHGGIQYSLFKKWTQFNAAVGTDLGFIFAKDTLSLGSTKIVLDPDTKGALNADFFLPVSYTLKKNYRVVLTPRISCNTLFIKRNVYSEKSQKYSPIYPALSFGAFLNKLYIEATAMYIENSIRPGFGIVYLFPDNNDAHE